MCSCGCQTKEAPKPFPTAEEAKKSYICYQCNTFMVTPATAPAPECCGKKMQEMD